MSSWLPQNIQKRVFRYVLDRLAVFSSLDLDDLDVKLGTTRSHLSLQNVRLDPDRLTLPGLFTRDGKIGKLDIFLDVMSGVNIDGSDVEITIALASKGFEEDELSDLLTRTTADLAESVMHTNKNDADYLEEQEEEPTIDSGERGYGLGDFSSVVARIADASISQLNVVLHNISVHLVLEDNTTVSCDIAEIKFFTDSDDKRNISVKDLQFYTWEDDEGSILDESYSPEPLDSDSDDSEEEDDGGIHGSLTQSTIFQKFPNQQQDESMSLYMSAVAHPPEPVAQKRHAVFLTCDSLHTSFKGVKYANSHLKLGHIVLSIYSSCNVLVPLLNMFNNVATTHSGEPEISAEERDSKGSSSAKSTEQIISQVSIDCLEVLLDSKNSQFEPERLALRATTTNIDIRSGQEVLLTSRSLSLEKGDVSFFTFEDDTNDKDVDDITIHVLNGSPKILLPKVAQLNISIDNINSVLDSLYSVQAVLGTINSGKAASGSASSSMPYVRTNTISVNIAGGITSIEASIFPVTYKEGTGLIDKIRAQLRYVDEEGQICKSSVELDMLAFVTTPSKGKSLVENTPLVINNELRISSANLALDYRILESLQHDLRSLHRPSPQAARPTVHSNNSKGRVKIAEDTVDFRISIKKLESELNAPIVGLVNIDLRDLSVQLNTESSETDIGIQRFSLSKDFGEIDGSGVQPLVHVANPLELNRSMVIIGLEDNEIKDVKLYNTAFEYHVRLIKLFEANSHPKPDSQPLDESCSTVKDQSELRFPVFFLDCCIGLTPYNIPSKALFILRDASTVVQKHPDGLLTLELVFMRATLFLIDDVKNLSSVTAGPPLVRRGSLDGYPGTVGDVAYRFDPVIYFKKLGYVSVATLSSSRIWMGISDMIQLKLSSELITLESCADSTQTLMLTLSALKPPFEVSKDTKYHTEVNPVDIMKDITEAAFSEERSDYDTSAAFSAGKSLSNSFDEDLVTDDLPTNLEFVESYYGGSRSGTMSIGGRSKISNGLSSSNTSSRGLKYSMADLLLDQDLSTLVNGNSREDSIDESGSNTSASSHSSQRAVIFEQRVQSLDSSIKFSENYISLPESEDNVPKPISGESEEEREPIFLLDLEDTRVVWNLYDGYDWTYTQDTIRNVVQQVEVEAAEARRDKLSRSQMMRTSDELFELNDSYEGPGFEDDREELVGDILFNSIYIGLPSGDDPKNLRKVINREINDDVSDTTFSSNSRVGSSQGGNRLNGPDGGSKQSGGLRLKRSKNFKVRVELTGISAKVTVIQGLDMPVLDGKDGMLLNRADLWVKDMEIIDNVPTSTWNKFLTYMRSAGPREMESPLIGISIRNVRPLVSAAVSEMILSVSILPLRLHIDQDTLDFLTRFFEFKDERFVNQTTSDALEEDVFIQKTDIKEFRIKLDYKPKKVDYAGLKSGHTTEFMNFFILDEADIVLKHVTLHGVTGFPRLISMLNDVWLPDIRSNQLGEVLSGLAPVRSLVKIGSGMRDLVVVPLREYQRDRRVVPGLQKGAWSFARNTTNELVKLGAKLAAGTQAILESAEQVMGGVGSDGRQIPERPHQRYISPYSDNVEEYVRDFESDDDDRTVSTVLRDRRRSSGYGNNEGAERRAVSLYADQPLSLNQGLRDAYKSFGRNLKMAREAVEDIPNDAGERGNAQGAAVAVMKAAPVAMIRPIIGATEAVSKTLLGVTNQLDPEQRAEASDKYKPTR